MTQSYSVHERVDVSLTGNGNVGRMLMQCGVPVFAIGPRGPTDVLGGLLRLRRLIRQLAPDVVQTWMPHSKLLGGITARLAGHGRVIWGVRTTRVSFGGSPASTILKRLCVMLSHWISSAIVCVADAAMRSHALIDYDRRRMFVIQNGFDAEVLLLDRHVRDRQRSLLDIPQQGLVVGAIGRQSFLITLTRQPLVDTYRAAR